MDVDDASDTVTICKGQGLFLRADTAGLLIRNFHFGSARRIAWSEISSFTDGRYTKEAVTRWMLVIVLCTGKEVPVLCSVLWPPGEVVAAVREVAQQHGIPADLAGVPMKAGRPVHRGFYHDPGGQAGLMRHWDGNQWSPLLPPDVINSRSTGVRPSSRSWSALPTADSGWTYATIRATRCTVWFAVSVAVSLTLLAGGLITELQDRSAYHGHGIGAAWFVASGLAAVYAFTWLGRRKFFRKLDEAARGLRGVGFELGA